MYYNSFVRPCTTTVGLFVRTLKKCQITSTYNINLEYHIWSFCYNLLLDCADNRHTNAHKPTAKNVI